MRQGDWTALPFAVQINSILKPALVYSKSEFLV